MPALPSGAILMWSGSIAAIPSGFVLCDGNNGTPDLRDRFVIGAGTTYNPNDTGGATGHLHTFVSDGHFHILPLGPAIWTGATWHAQTDVQPATGTTAGVNHLPPYYALCYIMKT